jgi:hypothetical protein
MEIESHFLSNETTRLQLQNHLERMLISLNTSPSSSSVVVVRRKQQQQQQQHAGGGNGSTTAGGSSSSAAGVECNLILSQAHVLNLKLFHPPKVPASPVPDRAVPVLLKRDWQVQTVRTYRFCFQRLKKMRIPTVELNVCSFFVVLVRAMVSK